MTSYEKLDLRYVAIVGSGSFGRVELAWSDLTKQYYAVKKFNIHEVVQEGHAEYANRERQVLRSVENPFIVKLICTHMDKLNLLLVTEFVEGGELRDYLNDMSERELHDAVRFYSMEIICALQHIHLKNIVLRDLKPENLLLSKDGHVKIADFGLAKILKGKTYTICGTPEFMAPEVLSKRGYGMEVDWWSLGVLIFELICGRTPFSGGTTEETYEAIRRRDLKFPHGFHPAERKQITLSSCYFGMLFAKLFSDLQDNGLNQYYREVVEKLLDHDPCKRAPDKSTLSWYADVNWDDVRNLAIQPPFKPAPFKVDELRPLEQSDEVASMQRERDLFAEWCEFLSE